MTFEDAIKTLEIAIAEVEWEYPMEYAVAFEMAIKALNSQQEAEKNEPLTLDELRKMDGYPVWFETDLQIEDGISAMENTKAGTLLMMMVPAMILASS